MQGIESLDNFKKFVSSLGGLGRYEDTYIVHAAEGETVVPMEVLDKNPALKKRLFQSMMDMGIEPGRYIVGNELNSRNPVTGQPEFFLKRIVSQIRKALPGDTEQFLGPIVGLATGNPFLGALAGAVGSGTEGAITGGLTGFRSPGIGGLSSDMFGGREIFGQTKVSPLDLGNLTGEGELRKFFLGEGGEKSGIFGKSGKLFDFGGCSKPKLTLDEYITETGLDPENLPEGVTRGNFLDQYLKLNLAKDSVLGGMSLGDAAKLYGLTTAGLGLLLKLTEQDQEDNLKTEYERTNEIYDNIVNMQGDRPTILGKAEGGVMDLRQGGESEGPGTGTSDDIPAMLSDGEFVMTAKAGRGAGGGDRREGAKRMYQMMDNLEAQA